MIHPAFRLASLSLVLGACTGTLEGYVGGEGGSSAGGAGAGGIAGDAGQPNAGGGSVGADAGPALSGPEAFAALCAPCHGSEGQGSPLGPELQHPVADYAAWVVRNGRATTEYAAAMVAFGPSAVSDAQLDEIWNWLAGFPAPTSGQGLYQDYCASCHGDDALGGRVGKNIEDKGLTDLEEKVREGEGGNDYGNTAQYMPHWGVAELSREQLELIADYIATL